MKTDETDTAMPYSNDFSTQRLRGLYVEEPLSFLSA